MLKTVLLYVLIGILIIGRLNAAEFKLDDEFDAFSKVDSTAGWNINDSLMPKCWWPVSRTDRKEQSLSRTDVKGIMLNGMIMSDIYEGVRNKTLNISVKAKGSSGSLKIYLVEYINNKSKDVNWIAQALDTETDDSWKSYNAVITIPPWHADDAVKFCLDGKNVEIKSFKVTEKAAIVNNEKVRCRIPLNLSPPKINGNFYEGKWENSICFETGLATLLTSSTITRQSKFYLTADRENIYICVLCPTPSGGFTTQVTKSDGDVFMDDSVEIYVNSIIQPMVYQIVTNFNGTVLDIEHAVGQSFRSWNCKGLRVKKGHWQGQAVLEMAIPAKSVGIDDLQKPWKLNICRNIQNPHEDTNLTGKAYNDYQNMIECTVDPSAPAISWGYSGESQDGRFTLSCQLYNPTTQVMDLDAVLSTGPSYKKENLQKILLASGEKKKVSLDLMDNKLVKGFFKCLITASNGNTYFTSNINFATSDLFTTQLVSPASKLNPTIEYYPFQKKINVRFERMQTSDYNDLKRVIVRIEGPSGFTLEKEFDKFLYAESEAHATMLFSPPQNGSYKITMTAYSANGEKTGESTRFIGHKDFPWLNNKIGKDSIVIPPFTPLKYTDDSVSCILRQYQFAPGGFPAQITANGHELLSGPVKLVAKYGSKINTGIGKKINFDKSNPDRAEFSTSIEYPGFEVSVKSWMEYDGIVFYTLTLIPKLGNEEINDLYLEIPVKDPKLLYSVGDAIRKNSTYHYIADLPRQGIIWTSMASENAGVYGNFIPYLWLGSNHSGLSWFAENDRGWIDNPQYPCMELLRQGQTVSIKVNLIHGPYKLDAKREISFGLMATPVKPNTVGIGSRPERNFMMRYFFNTGLLPVDDYLCKLITVQKDLMVYTAGQEYSLGDPEVKYFKDEIKSIPDAKNFWLWGNKKYGTSGIPAENYICGVFNLTGGLIDLYLWRINNLFENFNINGVYLDNSYPYFNKNIQIPNTGFIRDDGQVQAGCNLLLSREYIKRCMTLAYLQNKKPPRFLVHATDAVVMPCFAFADLMVVGEMNIPAGKDHFDVFTPAETEIQLGVNWGLPIGMLTMAPKNKTIEMLAMFKQFDIFTWGSSSYDAPLVAKYSQIEKAFGTGQADCSFIGYWDPSCIKTSENEIHISFYVRTNKGALVYVVNPTKNTIDASLKIDLSQYGINEFTVTDADNSQSINVEKLSIAGRNFRVLLIYPKKLF